MTTTNIKRTLFLLLLVMIAGIALSATAHTPQAVIVVNSAADNHDMTDGLCTLREAMGAANKNVASSELDNECPAGDGADTITFDLDPGTTIELNGNPLTFSDTVTIEGLGAADLTIDAGGLNRVIHVTVGTAVTITGITLQDGAKPANFDDVDGTFTFNGAGILNEGTLLLDDVVVLGNFLSEGDGAGIHALNAHTTILNSTIVENVAVNHGGAVFNRDSVLIIEDSLIMQNEAGQDGGGIYISGGTLEMMRTRVVANSAVQDGGGFYNLLGDIMLSGNEISGNGAENGAGLASNGGFTDEAEIAYAKIKLINNTIVRNDAEDGGGMMLQSTSGSIIHNTIYDNEGGGIASTGAANLSLHNTIIAHSSAVSGSDCTGLTVSNKNSLDSDGSCAVSFTGNPDVAPLADDENGIRFHALLPDSPAIGQASRAICLLYPADTTGKARPVGHLCDIGAAESDTLESFLFLPVTLSN